MIARLAPVVLLLGAAPADPLARHVAGQPAECIDIDRVQGPDIVNQRTILYRENRQRIWRTGPVGPCSSMHAGDTLIVYVSGRRLCSNDAFQVRGPGTLIAGAPCRFDRFTPYLRAN